MEEYGPYHQVFAVSCTGKIGIAHGRGEKKYVTSGGGGTLVSGVTGIPLFYEWLTYHYGEF